MHGELRRDPRLGQMERDHGGRFLTADADRFAAGEIEIADAFSAAGEFRLQLQRRGVEKNEPIRTAHADPDGPAVGGEPDGGKSVAGTARGMLFDDAKTRDVDDEEFAAQFADAIDPVPCRIMHEVTRPRAGGENDPTELLPEFLSVPRKDEDRILPQVDRPKVPADEGAIVRVGAVLTLPVAAAAALPGHALRELESRVSDPEHGDVPRNVVRAEEMFPLRREAQMTGDLSSAGRFVQEPRPFLRQFESADLVSCRREDPFALPVRRQIIERRRRFHAGNRQPLTIPCAVKQAVLRRDEIIFHRTSDSGGKEKLLFSVNKSFSRPPAPFLFSKKA